MLPYLEISWRYLKQLHEFAAFSAGLSAQAMRKSRTEPSNIALHNNVICAISPETYT
jgi:hypothetical protein